MYSVLFLVTLSFLCCYGLTPVVAAWSRRRGYMDEPGARRVHADPTPRTGGIAIAVSCLVPLGLLLVSPLAAVNIVNLPVILSVFPATALVFGLGLWDDLAGVSARQKLLVQILAACLAYAAGVHVYGVAGYVAPHWLSLPITVLWLVACTNAFNLIDGVDGLASGVGLLAAFTMLAAALLQGNAPLALATAPLVGALLAFLRYNFNPASIFLGDSGSLTIGFMLGCFGAIWSQKSATLLGMTAPLMALAIPLLDTSLSVVRRFLRRQSIFTPDRNHIHHRLLERGFSPRQAVLVLYGAGGLAALFSLLQAMPSQRFGSLLLVVFCVVLTTGAKLIGYMEFYTARRLLQTGSFRSIVSATMFVSAIRPKVAKCVAAEDYWAVVREVRSELGCTHVRMSLGGATFEERGEAGDGDMPCVTRIALPNRDYMNFAHPTHFSVRQAITLSMVAKMFQSALAQAQPQRLPSGTFDAHDVMPSPTTAPSVATEPS